MRMLVRYKVAELADARVERYVTGPRGEMRDAGRQAAGRAGAAHAAAHWSPLWISPSGVRVFFQRLKACYTMKYAKTPRKRARESKSRQWP
ncbi:hypothetical protein BVIET440_210082 [Burkholderia vietnamiensis]|nr:hypothetical protein BVI2075_610048 [Burkholderia vietnamiensis]